MPPIPELTVLFQRFGIALGLGLMIGVEREREKVSAFAGIRTFPLIALLGCAAALLNEHLAPWSYAVGLVVVAAFVLASYVQTSTAGSPGITTEIASLLAFVYGGLVWWQMTELAAALALVTVLLLATKRPLAQLSQRIEAEDIAAALQFGVITLIVLPILPDQTYGPLDVLNPRQIWQMVVLIAAINLVGYALIKLLGSQHGIGLAGLLGGLASSTATALGFSRHSREDPHLAPELSFGIVLASTIMFVRVLVVVFAIDAALGRVLLLPFAVVIGVGLLGCAYLWFVRPRLTGRAKRDSREQIKATNPFELWPAIQFGLLFGVVLFVSRAAQEFLGSTGVYLSSAAAGLADVDAITLSLSNLAGSAISRSLAAQGITLAALANTGVKAAISAAAGAPQVRQHTLPILAIMIVAGIGVSFLLT